MKQKNKKIIIYSIMALIILAGIVMVGIFGFNKELRYEQSQSIDINIEQEVDYEKIKNIVNENLGTNNMVQIVEVYEDMVTIRAKSITEEQKNNIVNKIKENYEFEQTAENINIKNIPGTNLIDMFKKYIFPLLISGLLVVAYMTIRYHKKGMIKVFLRTTIIPIIAQLLLFSIIAILRIPTGRFVPVFIIFVYIISVLYVIRENEK